MKVLTTVPIKICRLRPNAWIPGYAHGPEEDAGMDLKAVDTVILNPGVPTLIDTGLAMVFPSGWHGEIRPRSGLALKHSFTVANSPATIDPGFRGEIKVIGLWHGHNPNVWMWGGEQLTLEEYEERTKRVELGSEHSPEWETYLKSGSALVIRPGERIAQMLVTPYGAAEWREVTASGLELEQSNRGEGGFGSSGR